MFDLNKNTYYVIGDPIGHSLSPVIHETVFQALRKDCHYKKMQVKQDQLGAFIESVRKSGCPGFNATIPHKEAVIPFLDDIDPSARRIGAVNTVHQKDGKITGYNTDVPGLTDALKRGGWTTGERVLLLGAGGAARAAIEAMGLMGVRELMLFDLIEERVRTLASDFGDRHAMRILPVSPSGSLKEIVMQADLIINATPVGMWPKTELSPIAEASWIHPASTVFDMVYKPLKTKLMQQAESRGVKTISGLGMLVAQALAADEIWLDIKLPDDMFDKVWEVVINS